MQSFNQPSKRPPWPCKRVPCVCCRMTACRCAVGSNAPKGLPQIDAIAAHNLILVVPSQPLVGPRIQDQWLCAHNVNAGGLQICNFLRTVGHELDRCNTQMVQDLRRAGIAAGVCFVTQSDVCLSLRYALLLKGATPHQRKMSVATTFLIEPDNHPHTALLD